MFKLFQKPKEAFLQEESQEKSWLESTPRRVKRITKTERANAKQAIINYLLTKEGKEVRYADIARNTGYALPTISNLMSQLLRAGNLKRMGQRTHYRYRVVRTRIKGAKRVSNTKKPLPKVKKMPEVVMSPSSIEEKVYAFISRNEDVLMNLEHIARGIGSSTNYVQRVIVKLAKDGVIVRSVPVPRHGTRYWLKESLENGPKPTQVPMKLVAKSKDSDLYAVIDTLVWEYLKEANQTDILGFLAWLKQRK